MRHAIHHPTGTQYLTVTAHLMGTTAHLTLLTDSGPEPIRLATEAVNQLRDLERLWSRFLPDSDVTRINEGAGSVVEVDPRTAELVAIATQASIATGGLFSPLVGAALVGLGYRDPWQTRWAHTPVPVPARTYEPCDAEAVLVHHRRHVQIPAQAQLDLGGIAKGRAADLVAGWLNERTGSGAIVNIGGDLRVITTSHDERITVHVDDPNGGDTPFATWTLRHGGVATSSTLRRQWPLADGSHAHHLVDPATGTPTVGPRYVSVVAGCATDAEILTKVAIVGGVDAARGWATGSIRVAAWQPDGARVLLSHGTIHHHPGTTHPHRDTPIAAAS